MHSVVKLTHISNPSKKIQPRSITRALGQGPRFWPRMAISRVKSPKIAKIRSFLFLKGGILYGVNKVNFIDSGTFRPKIRKQGLSEGFFNKVF